MNYNGQPVPQGRIDLFLPRAAKGGPLSGDIADGSYSLTTAITGDGAIPGPYKVSVIAKERPATKAASKFGRCPQPAGGRQAEQRNKSCLGRQPKYGDP